MGDVADMMLDGTLCQTCGEYLGNPTGYPRSCRSCGGDKGAGPFDFRPTKKLKPAPKGKKVQCQYCNRKAKEGRGMADHMRVMHPGVMP
jgi:hypothetical protein